jgi:hypothetical protein
MIRIPIVLILLSPFSPVLAQLSNSELLSGVAPADDYPSIFAAKDFVYTAWIKTDLQESGDRIVARNRESGNWKDEETVTEKPGRRYRTEMTCNADGHPILVWTEERDSGWQLMMSVRDGQWSDPVELTDHPGPDIHPRLATSRNGTVWIVWQRFEERNSEILLAQVTDNGLVGLTRITQDPASDWDPSIAVDSRNRVHIAWDSYRHGDYDIFYRRLDSGSLSPPRALTSSPNFEAHVSIAVDQEDRLWVAWDDGGLDWGKDWPGNGGWKAGSWKSLTQDKAWIAGAPGITTRMGGLHRVDRFHIARLAGSEFNTPGDDFEASLPEWMQSATEYPRLFVDSDGRVSVLFRFNPREPYSPNGTLGARPKRVWIAYIRTLTANGWSDPIEIPFSGGRNHHLISGTWGRDGQLLLAYPSDGRNLDTLNPQKDEIRIISYTKPGSPPPGNLVSASPPTAKRRTTYSRPRTAAWSIGDETYRLYRGDLHRHTELSGDGSWDGSLLDFFRYGLDAASLDFIAITDHGYGTSDYMWWHIQKMTDVFHLPGLFVPIHGYERSMTRPNAHRNVFMLNRGYRDVGKFLDNTPAKNVLPDDTLRLWDAIRGRDTITVPHTINNTDWKDNDPDLEPLMEIYQGCRNSYEGEGSPKTSGGGKLAGSAWEALGKGYRIGFISSSDHRSTHISYANLWAKELTRPALFEAMRARRTFGSTETIVAKASIADNPCGSELSLTEVPTLNVDVDGTTRLNRVDIIRDSKVVYSVTPGVESFQFSFTDTDTTNSTKTYYYVRVLQEDEQVAWLSPIWIERK